MHRDIFHIDLFELPLWLRTIPSKRACLAGWAARLTPPVSKRN
jgi:hypothetical protein